jgi:aminopeptidase N
LQQQLINIKDPDRKKRMEFLMPALSPDVKVRDDFFASLKQEKNREKEAWVATALQYLHHPLRTATSQKYLRESLDLLHEIQQTGDIFFPQSWLQSTFSAYQTREAADIITVFLKEYPMYNRKLKGKILQATDPVFRAVRLVH